jgi:hypothetical protein
MPDFTFTDPLDVCPGRTDHLSYLAAPISNLPLHTLKDIFDFYTAECFYSDELMPTARAAADLALVCSTWRYLVYNTPTVWSYISISGRSVHPQFRRERRALFYSQEAPLTVSLDLREFPEKLVVSEEISRAVIMDGITRMLLPHAPRIFGLKIQQDSPFDIPVLELASNLSSVRMPMLRDFDISFSRGCYYDWEENEHPDEEGDFSTISLPSNSSLRSLQCCGTIVRWGLGTAMFTGLRQLAFYNLRPGICLSLFINALTVCADTLEDLEIQGSLLVDVMRDPPSLISLPRLHDLVLGYRTEEEALAIFRFFDVTELRLLYLRDITRRLFPDDPDLPDSSMLLKTIAFRKWAAPIEYLMLDHVVFDPARAGITIAEFYHRITLGVGLTLISRQTDREPIKMLLEGLATPLAAVLPAVTLAAACGLLPPLAGMRLKELHVDGLDYRSVVLTLIERHRLLGLRPDAPPPLTWLGLYSQEFALLPSDAHMAPYAVQLGRFAFGAELAVSGPFAQLDEFDSVLGNHDDLHDTEVEDEAGTQGEGDEFEASDVDENSASDVELWFGLADTFIALGLPDDTLT